MALEAGTRLGHYEVVSSLGAGGMGEVYRAKDTPLDRDVAIKVLPAELSEDETYRKRLEREAKTISQLHNGLAKPKWVARYNKKLAKQATKGR